VALIVVLVLVLVLVPVLVLVLVSISVLILPLDIPFHILTSLLSLPYYLTSMTFFTCVKLLLGSAMWTASRR
jgi:hypothetical protein